MRLSSREIRKRASAFGLPFAPAFAANGHSLRAGSEGSAPLPYREPEQSLSCMFKILLPSATTPHCTGLLPKMSDKTTNFDPDNHFDPDDPPAPEARKSLAHPEASNAKPEGWVKQETRSSPVGAAQESPCPKKSQGLKAISFESRTARLKSCPDTCPVLRSTIVFTQSCYSSVALLRASVPPWWRFSQ